MENRYHCAKSTCGCSRVCGTAREVVYIVVTLFRYSFLLLIIEEILKIYTHFS